MTIDWDRTSRALETFTINQQTRQQKKHTRRQLLKISYDKASGQKYLEIKKDSIWTRIEALLWRRGEYKLKNIVGFLQASGFEKLDEKKKTTFFIACPFLTQKISKHNARIFAFEKIAFPNFAVAMVKLSQDKQLREQLESFIDLLTKAPVTSKTELDARKKRLAELQKAEKNSELQTLYTLANNLVKNQEDELNKKAPVVEKTKAPEGKEIFEIIKQEGDGNCLLRSFAVGVLSFENAQAKALLQRGQKPEQAHPAFRKIACEWLESYLTRRTQNPDDQLETLFKAAIVEHNRVLGEKLQQFRQTYETIIKLEDVTEREKKAAFDQLAKMERECKEYHIPEEPIDKAFERYVALSKKDRFFCDMPHLYALSRYFNVGVQLYQKSMQPDSTDTFITIDPFKAPNGATDRVILHFDQAGSHYNAVLGTVSPLQKQKPPAVETTAKVMPQQQPVVKLGSGIVNPGINACYINSTLQALRVCPSFKDVVEEHHSVICSLDEYSEIIAYTELLKTLYSHSSKLRTEERTKLMKEPEFAVAFIENADSFMGPYYELLSKINLLNPKKKEQFFTYAIVYMLHDMYENIEKGIQVDRNTIQAFRGLIFALGGFGEKDSTLTSQEDARSLVAKLFELFRIPLTKYQTKVEHGIELPVPSLKSRSFLESIVPVRLGTALDNTDFSELVQSNVIMEEIDRQAILGQERPLTDSQKQAAQQLPNVSQTPTVQQFMFDEQAVKPELLAFTLTRYESSGTKSSTKIQPSDTLDIVIGKTGKFARYKLVAATVHSGANVRSGHYYTYLRQEHGAGKIWVECNDSKVMQVSDKSAEDDIAKQGYLFYYEYKGDIEGTTPGEP